MKVPQIIKNILPKKALVLFTAASPKQEYDALKPDDKRENPTIRTDATETEQMFTADKRIKSYIWADHLYDNDGIGSTLDTIVRLAVGTKGGIPIFTGDGAEEAQQKFDKWKKAAGFAEDEHWQDLLGLILRIVKLHGDCVILMDNELTGGKLRIWDADQICNITDADFRKTCDEHGWYDGEDHNDDTRWRQVEGVVIDTMGRVQGYFVTPLRNRYSVGGNASTFLPVDLARRVSSHKKITQYRGESVFLPTCEITEDTRSLIKSEVASARLNAEHSFFIKRSPVTIGGELDGLTAEQVVDGTDISEEQVAQIKQAAKNTTDYSAFDGKAAIGFIGSDQDVIKMDNANRPAAAIQQWLDKLDDANGKRLGVMSCLARGRADNSYSSGQIELSISWSSFEEYQKMLERQVVDYVCEILCPGVSYTVTWPKAFEIDPQKAEQTKDMQLRGGRTDFEELLGPYWKKKLQKLADQKKFLEENGLTNLSFFQTPSGAQAQEQTEDDDNDNGNQQRKEIFP